MKKRVAVFFGGRSPEHDVSIVTGLQALAAFDTERYSAFPVYVTVDGDWLTGDALRDTRNYLPKGSTLSSLQSVMLDVRTKGDRPAQLIPSRSGLFSSPKPIEFDVAYLAFHGHSGENGGMQGLFEVAGVPYTGVRLMACSIFMNKLATKRMLAGTSVSVLPSVVLSRPQSGLLLSEQDILSQLGDLKFPLIVKPMNLGSSIGAARAENVKEVRAALPAIFKLDIEAILEPFVDNLVEYNVAVRRVDGRIVTSAIECPKRVDALLDFKTKYLSNGTGGPGNKVLGSRNQGLLALTRELNPSLPAEIENNIRTWAEICFDRTNATGAPRIDFLANKLTGQIWLNEVNPCPGSFGYFLWEAAETPVLFTELTSFLIEEALAIHAASQIPPDPTNIDSRLFARE